MGSRIPHVWLGSPSSPETVFLPLSLNSGSCGEAGRGSWAGSGGRAGGQGIKDGNLGL